MHQTRKEASIKLPIRRKGTKYIARARGSLKNSVPVVVAVRDMLGLSKTSKEVKKMVQQKLLKINGRPVRDIRESINLFSIFEADKHYLLVLSANKKFLFEEIKPGSPRLVGVVNKRLVRGGYVQINLHDGSNIISKEKIGVGDSLYIGEDNTIKEHIKFGKGSNVIIISGKYAGEKGKIESFSQNKCTIQIKKDNVVLNRRQVIIT